MAAKKKKSSGKKSPSKKKPAILNEFKKIFVGIAILVSICLTGAMIADLFFHPGRIQKKNQVVLQPRDNKPAKKTYIHPAMEDISEDITIKKPKQKLTGLKEKSKKIIKYEVFEDVDHSIIEKPVSPVKVHTPRVAIIIDDIGYDKKMAFALYDLNLNITFSVLPFSPFGKYISEKLHSKGSQIMLHLPMEPVKYPKINPGPGAILSAMPPDTLLDQLKQDLRDVPYIAGVNNHMGSRLTTHSDQMNQIFTILKKENLFFIDSRTSAKSQCKASARLLMLKFAQRDVFLDNIQDTVYITGQLKKLIHLARKHGFAIGIGHPYKATLEALLKQSSKLKNRVKLVRAGILANIPG